MAAINIGPTCTKASITPPAPATAPISGNPVKHRSEEEYRHAENNAGQQNGQQGITERAGLAAANETPR